MQGVAVIPQCHPVKRIFDNFLKKINFHRATLPAVGGDVIDVNVLVDIDNKLSLRVNLHQHLLLVHGLNHLHRYRQDTTNLKELGFGHLADVAALLLKVLELLTKHSHLCVELVSLSLQPASIETFVVWNSCQNKWYPARLLSWTQKTLIFRTIID